MQRSEGIGEESDDHHAGSEDDHAGSEDDHAGSEDDHAGLGIAFERSLEHANVPLPFQRALSREHPVYISVQDGMYDLTQSDAVGIIGERFTAPPGLGPLRSVDHTSGEYTDGACDVASTCVETTGAQSNSHAIASFRNDDDWKIVTDVNATNHR